MLKITVMKKMIPFILLFAMILSSCAANSSNNNQGRASIEINNISSGIGAVGENTNEMETQSFQYTVNIINNDATDLKILSLQPILSEEFLERVLTEDLIVQVNKTISQGGSLNISGEIIFDANGLTKEQIIELEPFVSEVKITEERVIEKPF